MNPEVLKEALPEVLTQLLGFLIVFFVLKRFAFKPVLGIVDARRKKIEDEFQSIEERKKGLEAVEKDYRRRLETIEETARVKIQEAVNEGLALARDIQEKARLDAEKMIVRAKAEIEQDITKAKLSMRDELVELSGLMTEKIIRQKLDTKEQERMVDQFLKELEKVG